ncbi:helicase-related protein [Komagataeibacter sp. FNDCR2]|uniref:helicase-related protein n=1 Tax=Komagataeibacter sp. FNDCR2 TaxID=2878682 RepID=UPI001E572FA8|nr:helicase-related protein [Komagataeibacter sp. FNDCR2]MCE2576459.1 DNA helicase [Komagataeibacter sp. FNDCR2]
MTGVPSGPGGPYRTVAGQGSGPHPDMKVRAVLGPTNTGKTHLAIERLLAHSSGIIGFPLRLLARENYDRMVARKGAHAVALITGEEKIVPPRARWFSCTVEAMPLDRRVEFVAVDEIQLCADPDRGHIFTDRLLHARGTAETMFLGADTIRNLIRQLVPGIEIEHRPRLSQLTHAGACKLTRLPPRSAIVAFSASEVYAIAELLRRRRGGCAIVMGQLSPRTRNAQVALYQEKEVDYLVATDAIGMGLNMDVNHVAFASLSKFDGTRIRPLNAGEIAQVAGRAGRGLRDGTFGTTGTCPALREELAEAVEQHRFDPLTRLSWRNSTLDFSSPEALLRSLNHSCPRPELTAGHEASDMLALAALTGNTEIRPLVHSRAATRLLWESCQIPDFRKLGDDSHVRLCGRIFTHIIHDGRIPAAWMDKQLASFFHTEGTIDSLMQRLAGIRVCSYIASRTGWIANAEHWQARTREAEDRLSDILHEQLTARFVDRRATSLIRRLDEGGHDALLSAVTAQGNVVVEGHEVGRIAGLDLIAGDHTDADDGRLLMRAARRAVRSEIPRRVALLVQDEDRQFAFSADGLHILWQDMPIARLQPGADMLAPRPQVLDNPLLDNAQRERIRNRLQAWLGRIVHEHLAPLFAVQAAVASTPDLRGIVHRLREGAGIAVLHRGEHYGPDMIRRLRRLGIRVGHYSLFMPAILKERPMQLRGWLIAISLNMPCPPLPAMSRVTLPPDALPAPLLDRMGWLDAGPVRIRLDIAEKFILELARMTRRAPIPLPPLLASRLGVRREALPAVMKGLNMRVYHPRPMPAEHYGPPAPVMVRFQREIASDGKGKPQHPEKRKAGGRPALKGGARPSRRADSPFAALATLLNRS